MSASCFDHSILFQSKKLKDVDQKNRPLQEKNKKFLEKNIELTTLNRGLKDKLQAATEDGKKLVRMW
jgi:hypothetical protein